MRQSWFSSVGAAVALVVACKASSTGPVSGTFPLAVGPAGGTVEGLPGTALEGVRLEIPAGALDRTVVLDAYPATEDVLLGPTASFVGPKVALLPDSAHFSAPIRLTVPFVPASVEDFEQTAADCRVWFERDGVWSQVARVASTLATVTVEVDTLGHAAAGVVFASKPASGTTPATCDSPTGFCVDPLAGPLGAGAQPSSLSSIVGGRFAYHRADPVKVDASGVRTRSYGVVQYDVATGKPVLETPKFVTTSEPGRVLSIASRVSVAPDGTFWFAVPGYGAVQYLPKSAATQGVDATGAFVPSHVAVAPDGRRFRFEVTGGFAGKPAASLAVTTELDGKADARVVLESFTTLGFLDAVPVASEDARKALAYVVPPAQGLAIAKELVANTPTTPLPLPPEVAKIDFATNALDELAVSADGDLVAVSLAKPDALGARVYVRSRDGKVSRSVKGLPNLAGMEFASDNALWAFGATNAEIYRIDPGSGAVQTVALTTETPGTKAYADHIPVALRGVGAGVVLVVIGSSPYVVVTVHPSAPSCTAAGTCSSHGSCAGPDTCVCNVGFAGASCNQCALDYFGYPACTQCLAATTCNGHGLCTPSGACACNSEFAGAGCAQCAASFFNYPTCTFCQAAATCNAHGTCTLQGSCACTAGFASAGCDQCATNFFNYPTCTFCQPATTCNGHGTCNPQGGCACNTGYAGAACDQCAAGFTGYPNCV